MAQIGEPPQRRRVMVAYAVPLFTPQLDRINRNAYERRSALRMFGDASGCLDEGERVAVQLVADAACAAPILDIGIGGGRTAPLMRSMLRRSRVTGRIGQCFTVPEHIRGASRVGWHDWRWAGSTGCAVVSWRAVTARRRSARCRPAIFRCCRFSYRSRASCGACVLPVLWWRRSLRRKVCVCRSTNPGAATHPGITLSRGTPIPR
jgi:hypothetical protein